MPAQVGDGVAIRTDLGVGSFEFQLRGVLSDGFGGNIQCFESRDVLAEDGDVLGATAGDDEGLEGSEGEGRGTGCEEGGGAGEFVALREAVEAILFSLLADHGAEEGDEAEGFCAAGEGGLCEGERGKDDVGEGLSEGDGVVEGGDWEFVLAGCDCLCAYILQGGVDANVVKFLLLESISSAWSVHKKRLRIVEEWGAYVQDIVDGFDHKFSLHTDIV